MDYFVWVAKAKERAVVLRRLRELEEHQESLSLNETAEPAFRDMEETQQEGNCPPDLRALLLEAVAGPHHPMPADYFDQLRKRLRTSGAR